MCSCGEENLLGFGAIRTRPNAFSFTVLFNIHLPDWSLWIRRSMTG